MSTRHPAHKHAVSRTRILDDRQTRRQTDTKTDRHKDRQTQRQTDTKTDKKDRQTRFTVTWMISPLSLTLTYL
jgi:hypothetical protein